MALGGCLLETLDILLDFVDLRAVSLDLPVQVLDALADVLHLGSDAFGLFSPISVSWSARAMLSMIFLIILLISSMLKLSDMLSDVGVDRARVEAVNSW